MVDYAQLILAMPCSCSRRRDFALDKYMKQPDEIGGAETQSCYLVVSDADAHYARAKASGAEIILDIWMTIGGRSYRAAIRKVTSELRHVRSLAGNRLDGSSPRGTWRWGGVVDPGRPWLSAAVAAAAMYGALRQPGNCLKCPMPAVHA
jgi:hypothetical protein